MNEDETVNKTATIKNYLRCHSIKPGNDTSLKIIELLEFLKEYPTKNEIEVFIESQVADIAMGARIDLENVVLDKDDSKQYL